MKNDLVEKQNELFSTLHKIIEEQQSQINTQKKLLKHLYEDIDQLLKDYLHTDASTLTARVYSSLYSGSTLIDSLAIGLSDIREILAKENYG